MREEIIKMAREAGLYHVVREYGDGSYISQHPPLDRLERFFHMAQAAEREACAKVAFNAKTYIEAAKAIRARGQQ